MRKVRSSPARKNMESKEPNELGQRSSYLVPLWFEAETVQPFGDPKGLYYIKQAAQFETPPWN